MSRARPLAPAERRASIIATTIPLLREKGRAVSTREIAKAAGVAEGTIFRVFGSKDEIVQACIRDVLDTNGLIEQVRAIDLGQPLAQRLTEAVAIMQAHLRELIGLMVVLQPGAGEPPHRHDAKESLRQRKEATAKLDAVFQQLVGDDASQLRISVTDFLAYLRMLTLSSVHPMLDGTNASASELVDLVLDGARRRETEPRGIPAATSTSPASHSRGNN